MRSIPCIFSWLGSQDRMQIILLFQLNALTIGQLARINTQELQDLRNTLIFTIEPLALPTWRQMKKTVTDVKCVVTVSDKQLTPEMLFLAILSALVLCSPQSMPLLMESYSLIGLIYPTLLCPFLYTVTWTKSILECLLIIPRSQWYQTTSKNTHWD